MMKFSEAKKLNFDGKKMEKIYVTGEDNESVKIILPKCKSYGVRKSEEFENSKSMSLILNSESSEKLKKYISEIEDHLKVELSSVFYGQNNDSIYPKIRDRSVFYDENNNEINPFERFERKICNAKAVLEIEGVLAKEDGKHVLQLKIYEAKIYVRKHVRLLDMD